MRKLQVALCRNRFEPGNNQLCSSLPKVTVDSTFFLVIFSSNHVSPAWFLNKLAKILEYSSDHRQELVIFMAHEIDRSDVRKQIGNYQVESAKQKKSNHNRDEIVHIGETVPSGLMKLDAMHLSKQNARLPTLLSDESVGV